MTAFEPAIRIFAHDLVKEEVLGDDHIAFKTHDLGNMRDASGAVAQTGRLNDDVHGRHDHFANGPRRKPHAAHGDHRLKTP